MPMPAPPNRNFNPTCFYSITGIILHNTYRNLTRLTKFSSP